MNLPLVPNNSFGFEGGLLTALVIGFFFGFALERGGFGSAKKLAAQFYLYDMTVFKVMFSAILTAMTGLFALDAYGLVNLDLVWINPTFFWPQLIGGFMLGVGFLVSGLCPGTGFVSMASGKTDAFFAIGGIFLGTLLFGIALETMPFLDAFYSAPAAGRILLPELVGIPAPWLALGVVLMALGCFIGAEKVEALFEQRYTHEDDIERSRVPDKHGKFILAGSLAVICLVAAVGAPAEKSATADNPVVTPLVAMDLAESLIRREAGLVIMDLRGETTGEVVRIPGAIPVPDAIDVPVHVSNAGREDRIILVAPREQLAQVPDGWPAREYQWLEGGIEAWAEQVLTPATPVNYTSEEMEWVRRQNQIAAYYSGAKVERTVAAPPPPASSGGNKKKKAAGGC